MVRNFGGYATQNLAKYKSWFRVLIPLTKKKDCDYVIYAKSMSIKRHKEKMSRVNGLPT